MVSLPSSLEFCFPSSHGGYGPLLTVLMFEYDRPRFLESLALFSIPSVLSWLYRPKYGGWLHNHTELLLQARG
jgi:hypothetical protein